MSPRVLPRQARPLVSLALSVALFFPAGMLACHDDSAGLQVAVNLDAGAGAAREFTTDQGYAVRLTRLDLSFSGFELRACPGARAPARRGRAGVAWAHSASTVTRLGDSVVWSPLSPGSVAVGSLAPPPGNYCSLGLDLAAADSDALGLPDAAMVGLSIRMEGTYKAPSAAAETAFSASVKMADSVSPALSLALAEGGREQAQLAVKLGSVSWFSGVDLATATPEQLGQSALQSAAAALAVEVR